MSIDLLCPDKDAKPSFEINLFAPKTDHENRIGWGEPWRPNIRIVTVLENGERHGLMISFDTPAKAKRFLMGGAIYANEL